MINNSAISKICKTKTFLLEVLIRKRGVLEKHYTAVMCMVLLKGANSNLTSYIQAIVTGKLCKRGHIIRIVGKIMSLLCNALCSLQDAVIVGSLK